MVDTTWVRSRLGCHGGIWFSMVILLVVTLVLVNVRVQAVAMMAHTYGTRAQLDDRQPLGMPMARHRRSAWARKEA
jgi:hypothetical protein